eukprot:Skav229193  [mRNA]  locus=scaffold1004:461011:462088:+ [translate_table: standard]
MFRAKAADGTEAQASRTPMNSSCSHCCTEIVPGWAACKGLLTLIPTTPDAARTRPQWFHADTFSSKKKRPKE